jgi:hypothetical protein
MRQHQQRSLEVMLDFFGLTREENGIVAQPTLAMPTHIWLKAGGHNHLRITRMIRSLALCHQPAGSDRNWQPAKSGIRHVSAILAGSILD